MSGNLIVAVPIIEITFAEKNELLPMALIASLIVKLCLGSVFHSAR